MTFYLQKFELNPSQTSEILHCGQVKRIVKELTHSYAEKKELGLIVMVGCISMSSEGVNRGTDVRNLETRIVVILYHQKIREVHLDQVL